MRKVKNILILIGLAILFVLYEMWSWSAQESNSKQLGIIWEEMKKTPISIAYVILTIVILYFIGKLRFFEGMQIGKNDPFDRDRKSKGKEILSTIVFGLILFAFIIGFFVIMLK